MAVSRNSREGRHAFVNGIRESGRGLKGLAFNLNF
jgi:hypothetical protein